MKISKLVILIVMIALALFLLAQSVLGRRDSASVYKTSAPCATAPISLENRPRKFRAWFPTSQESFRC